MSLFPIKQQPNISPPRKKLSQEWIMNLTRRVLLEQKKEL